MTVRDAAARSLSASPAAAIGPDRLRAEVSASLAANAADQGAREFAFVTADFERVRKLIYDYAGISLAPIKRDMVYSRLARRLRATGCSNFTEYLDKLDRPANPEWEFFVNSLTTNLTSFFREEHHFDILKRTIREKWKGRPLKIWCSAASTGEEPYSIAMAVIEAFESMSPPVQIIASDLDTNCLADARKAEYAMERVEKINPARLSRFFLKGSGAQQGSMRVRPELVKLIEFRRVNLLEANWQIPPQQDALFCRNVMIYFDKATQYKILARFAPLLRADGLLFAGHSESFSHAADLFRAQGRTVYEPVAKNR